MTRLLTLILSLLLCFPFCVPVLAGSIPAIPGMNQPEASVPDSSFEGEYTENRHDDGSVTRTFKDGSVGTRYADGTFEGIDANGNRHTEDKDGTYTVYITDGSIAVERPDGTRELTEANGTKRTVNPDGSGKTDYACGLCMEYNADYVYTSAYFPGGSDRMMADENGEFPEGEITGPNGETFRNTDDGLFLKGKNGVEYSMEEDGNRVSVVMPDGGRMTSENGKAEIRFADGGVFNYTDDGRGVFRSPDGSYISMGGEGSRAWEMYDASSGRLIKVNDDGQLTDMYAENDDGVINIKDGKIVEYVDAKAGITIKCDESGTTVETPEGTYFADGKGTVTKDGKPLEMSQNKGKETENFPSDKYDDSYCERKYKGRDLWMSDLKPNYFYGEQYDPENGVYRYDWVHQIWDTDHEKLYVQEKYDMTVTMKKISVNYGEWLDNVTYSVGVADYSTDLLATQYTTVDDVPTPEGYFRMNLKVGGYDAVYVYTEYKTEGNGNGVMPYADNHGSIYVPITDMPNQDGCINTLVIHCGINGYNFELFDSTVGEYLALLQALPCTIDIEKKTENIK